MLSPKFVDPVEERLIIFLFVTFMFKEFALIAPETFKVPVKFRVLLLVKNTKLADPLVELEPVKNCIDPVGPAA